MLTLNLVSKELKKEIKLKNIYAAIKITGIILTMAAMVFSIIFLAAKYILKNNYSEVAGQTALVADADNSYLAKVKDINLKINSAQKIQKEYILWTNVFKKLADLTPQGITYSYLKIDKNEKSASLKGEALRREDLLALKDNLNNSNIFLNIESPLGDIFQKENITFSINMSLNILEIKN